MSEEAREAERQRRIKRAREFAERKINGQTMDPTKEDKALMVISSFLLVKEHIIKKDSKNNILYVSIANLEDYLEAMNIIVETILKSSSQDIHINELPIKEENTNISLPQEKAKAILIINKIRDSIAHSDYNFDENYENIIIDNSYTVGNDKYHFKVTVPVCLIEYMVTMSKTEYNKNSIEDLRMNVEDFFKGMPNSEVEQNRIQEEEQPIKEYKISGVDLTQEKDDSYGYTKYNKTTERPTIHPESIVKQTNKELLNLIKSITGNAFLTPLQKEKILISLREQQIVDCDFRPILIEEGDTFYAASIRCIILEVIKLIPTSSSVEEQEKLAALFNYMQMVFSMKIEEQKAGKNEQEINRYRYLRLSKLKPTIDIDLQDKISKQTKKFIKKGKKILENYSSASTIEGKKGGLKSLVSTFNEYKEIMYSAIEIQNLYTISRIRNATLHANIEESNGKVVLRDLPNKTNATNVTFTCEGTIPELFDLTTKIEDPNIIPEHITFDEFLNEIQYYGKLTDEQIIIIRNMFTIMRQELDKLQMSDLFEQTVSSFGGL